VLEADIVINVAKLKTHAYSGITAAVKNLFGCVSGLVKSQLHLQYPHKDEFDLMLFDILRLVKPTLNIVDAVVAMEGVGGPVTGNPRHMNLIIAGKDAVAVDAICAALTGKEPTDFNFLQLAQKRGFGEADLNKIEVVGENLAQRACHDFKHFLTFGDEMLPPMIPKVFVPYLRRILIDRPILNKRNCTKCGACLEVCAAKAITLEDGFPTFDYAKCIGCFCCQEMCEFSAIKIKKSLIARALFKLSSLIFSSKKW